MKILLLFTYNVSLDLWNKNGILNREISLYKKLIEKNVRIAFLTYGGNSDLNYSPILNDIKILPVKNLINSKNRRIGFLKTLILPFKLRKELKSIDIIKTNQLEGSWVAWLGKIIYRKKLIVRGGFEWLKFYILKNFGYQDQRSYRIWLKYFWRYFIEYISYKMADKIIITNPDDIDFIIKKFRLQKKKPKIHLLHNFIDTNLFKPLDLKKYDKRVLFIGRFNPQKNLINLIKSFKHLEGFNLDLVGDGPIEQVLKEKAENLGIKLNFLGKIPNSRLPTIINKYQIFILPSFYEGNPKVLLEAMSCGVACIGSDVWGIGNIIKHKRNGYLCETNPESIAEAIRILYHNKNLMKEIGENARQYILVNCSLDSISNKEYLIYRTLLETRKSSS